MFKLRTYYCTILFLCCLGQRAAAQYAEKDFVLYSAKNGLSGNFVTCLQQDDQGYLWIGTETGLSRFDGTDFKKFFQGNTPLNLPSDVITRLKKFGTNRLGIFSRGGLQVLHTNDYKVDTYIIPDSTSFTTPLNAVWDAVELPGNSFALSTAAGFYVVNEKGLQYRYDAYAVTDIGRKQVLFGRDIFNAGNGNFIVYANEDGQFLYNSHQKKFAPLHTAAAPMAALLNPRNFPGDRWILKRQLNEHEFLFVPLKTDSIIYYNSASNKRTVSPLPLPVAKQLTWESQLVPANDSTILLNTGYTGFYRLQLNRQTGTITCNEEKQLPSYQVKYLFIDKSGRLWAGTTQGLLKQSLLPAPVSTFHYPSKTVNEGTDNFTAVYRYKKLLYAGQYSRHHGLSIIDPVSMKKIKEIQFFGNDLPWNEVMTIEMYHADTLWLGTFAGLLWFDTRSEKYGKVLDENKYPWAKNFPAVLAPPRSDGTAWFCALLGGRVVRYDIASRTFTLFSPQTKPGLPFEKVKSIVYDSYGDVWIGGHALTRYNTRLQRFDTLIKVYAGTNKFNDDILTISADNNGSLWLHNADNGLLEYRIKEKRFVTYGTKEGFSSMFIHSMSRVINQQLWMVGNNQLWLLNTRSKELSFYDHNDGLPEISPTSRRISFDKTDSMMYVSAGNDLVRFALTPRKTPGTKEDLRLEELLINNNTTIFNPLGRVVLKYNENNLSFRFTIVDFVGENYRFSYKLNHEEAWTNIGNQHSLAFNNLSPGEYNFELTALGRSGVRKSLSLVVIIRPPFWAQTWFIILLILLTAVALAWFFNGRLKRIRQKAAIDKQLSQTEMKALQSQMNPHFIFNSLNSIREMILAEENKEASHYLSRFSQLIRITLEQSTQEMVSLRATIDYLGRYIEMEKIRNELLQHEFYVDPALDIEEILVSPMIIQPFVENAIWHGVSAKSKEITVKISFKKDGDFLICMVEDNGVGISYTQSLKKLVRQSHGINNVQERVKLLSEKYELPCSIDIIDKKEGPSFNETGTLVTIRLPYQTIEQ